MVGKIKYRGQAVAFQSSSFSINETGVATTTLRYVGITSALKSFAATFPAGNKINFQDGGATSQLEVQLGFLFGTPQDQQQSDKWEADTEELTIDLSNSFLANSLSQNGRRALNAYREMSPDDRLKFNFADYDVAVASDEAQTLTDLIYEVDRGVDSVIEKYLVLKRTRTMSATFVSDLRIDLKQSVYSTAALTALETIPAVVSDTLPTKPYDPPANTQWAWRPRMFNRSYTGRGLVEEQNDWVFGPHSTILYDYVAE